MDSPPRPPPRRFTLADLMMWVAGAGIGFALMTELGFWGVLLGLAGFVLVWSVRHIALADDQREAQRTVLWLAITLPLWGTFTAWSVVATMVELGLPPAGRDESYRGWWVALIELLFVAWAISRVTRTAHAHRHTT